jgi:uncharacterized phosphosugar-binding protein
VLSVFEVYIEQLQMILERIRREQATAIKQAGSIVADAIAAGGVVHTFGTGHSHLIAEEPFFRAGGIAAVNPILDERLMFLRGALESTRAERDAGLSRALIEREDVRLRDASIIISNSGRNAAPVEMALEMKARGVQVIAITNIQHSRASAPRNQSGKRLFELADVVIDNCTPAGDALMTLPGLNARAGPSSTVAGAAVINSIMIEAASELLRRGEQISVLPSANVDSTTADKLRQLLGRYQERIRYLDLETQF